MKFKISICKDYDPTKTKAYNNNKVAYGWHVHEKEWRKETLIKITTKEGISGNEYITDHKTKDNWKSTHALMFDFDNGKMTEETLKDLQKRWPYNSYIFSSQNHRRQKLPTNGGSKAEPAHDRLRALIPLKDPIATHEDHQALEAYILSVINKDGDYIDKTFMHKHRYFAHGTDEVSSITTSKGPMDWKGDKQFKKFKKQLEKEQFEKSQQKDKRGRPKTITLVQNVFRTFWKVKTKDNGLSVLKDLESKTEILCPTCGNDKKRGTPGAINAVYDFNEHGTPFIYCSSCESRGNGVSGKGIYNPHPNDLFIQRCLDRGFLLFRDAEMGDLICGINKINPKSGDTKWGYRKMPNMQAALEVLAMHGVDKPPFFPHFTYELHFDVKERFNFETQFVNKYVPSHLLESERPIKKINTVPKYIGKILSHVFAGDKEVIKHYVNDLADLIQTRKKRRTAFLLQGTEGTGKGLWFNRVLKPIIGREYCNEMDQGPFINSFNSSLENNVLTLVNECRANFTGSRGADANVVEKIKIAISDSDIEIERKGKDRYNGRNNSSFMFATNRLKAVVLPSDDRRFTIAPRQEKKIEKTSWWPGGSEIEKCIAKEVQEFTWYLMDYKVDKKKIGSVIQNKAKEIIQALSKTNAEEFFDAVKIGDVAWFEENLVERPGYRGEEEYLEIRTLFKSVVDEKNISKQTLCRLYNYIVHPGKPVTMNTFGKSAVAHLPEFKVVRISGNVTRGIPVNWVK